jgi:hypothetical protein
MGHSSVRLTVITGALGAGQVDLVEESVITRPISINIITKASSKRYSPWSLRHTRLLLHVALRVRSLLVLRRGARMF